MTNIRFVHQFPRRGKLIAPDFLAHHPAVVKKFGYLAERFRATVRQHPVTFVRRDLSEPPALRLESAMRALFPDSDMRFLYVNGEGTPFRTPLGHSVYLPSARSGLGDSIGWSRLLVSEGLVDRPYRLATSEVLAGNVGDNHIAELDRHSTKVLKEAMRENPENPWFAHELGTSLLARGRFRRALQLSGRALALDPQNPRFLELRIRALLGCRRVSPEEGLKQTTMLLETAESESSSLVALAAELGIRLGRPEEALSLLSRRLNHDPYNDELHALAARAQLAAGKGAEAEAAIDAALALHPGGKRLVALKARILCSLGRQREALRMVGEALRKNPSVRLRFLRAQLALGLMP